MSGGRFTQAQINGLRELTNLWGAERFVLIGAWALNYHRPMGWRQTGDLDIAIAHDVKDYPAGLDSLRDWNRHSRIEHQWHSPEGVQFDVIPARGNESSGREIVWPGSRRAMNTAGLETAIQHGQIVSLTDGVKIKIAPLSILCMLKMISYMDRPNERQRDLEDLANVIEVYADDLDNRRYGEDVIDAEMSFESVSAFLLGLDIAELAGNAEYSTVDAFVGTLEDENGTTVMRMTRTGPESLRREEDVIHERVGALRAGLAEGRRRWPDREA